jgi:hypothetical protein
MKENVACSAIFSQSMNIKFLSILLAIVFPATITFAQDNRILSFEQAKILADKGDAYGEAVVAFHYSIGWQTDKNLELAAKYAMSSARKNHPLGIFRLGTLRRAGEGVEKNEEQGLALQKNSFNGLNKMSGNPYAITSLGVMLFQGKVVRENKKEAARLYKIAADMGFAPAQFNFAMCAEAGHGTPQSELTSIEYLTKAIENDYTLALSALKHSNTESSLLQNAELQSDLNQNKTKIPSVSQSFLKHDLDQAYEIAQTVDQTYRLQGSVLGAYKGFIGNKPINFEVFLGNEKTIVGRASIGRAEDWDLVGLNKRDGEITLSAFYGNEEIGTFFLNKSSDAKNDRLVGKFLDKNKSALAVRITRIPDSDDCGPRHPFSDDDKPLANYLIWKNNDLVSLTMEPLLTMSLKRAGDIAHPNIKVWENLPDNLSSGLIYLEKKIVFVGYEKSISALDIETGGVIWKANLPVKIDEINLSANGNFIYVLGGTHSELRHTYSLWRIPVDSNGEAVELLRTLRSGSEGGFPVGALFPKHVPGTDKFIVEIDDEQNIYLDRCGFKSRKQSSGRQLFCFDAVEITLKRINSSLEAFKAYFTTKDYVPHAHLTEDTPLASIQSIKNVSAKINLIKRFSNLELYVLNEGTETTLRKWPLDSSGFPPLWFANGKVIGYDFLGSPTVFANTDEPGDFVFSTKVTSPGSNIKEQIQEIDSENYKIRAVAKYFGLFIEITDKHTGKKIFDSLKNELPIGIYDVGYMDDIYFDWFNNNIAILALPTGQFLLVDCSKPKPVELLSSENLPQSTGLLCIAENKTILSASGSNLYKITLDLKTNVLEEKYFVTFDNSGPSAIVFPDNLYSGYRGAMKRISAVANNRSLPFEQFDLRLNRPDIVLERLGAPDEAIAIAKQLREKRLKRMGVNEDMLQPDFHLPEIEIVGDIPSSTAESELAIKIKATDSKYPLDRLRVYVNNVPVNGKEGELLRDSKSQALERTIPIKLAAGRNKIQISVLNSAGAESLYANADVTCTAQRPKPTLYAVAMGVSEYANPDWNLKYAAKDARDILERVKARSGSSYGEIKELLLTNRDATKESLGKIREFLSTATVDDTVLMFVAGHGLLDSKYDYYFGTSDIDFDTPSGKGIAFEEFDDLLAELPCLKKSLLIDTCHAGELDEDEKKILASASGTSAPLPAGQGIAVRSVGTRGMSIKPIEGARGKSEWYDRLQGLFVDLRRGSGSTILSSSAGAEYALESSEQKNGLFTYAVLEALDGKEGSDANKDGSVTMSELADYVKTRVAALTNNKQSPNVRRVNLESDFTVASKSPLEPTFSKPSIGNFIK